ncbi:uncharacterized protein LOC125680946 [Ostrea edulis]|uniref:uncharacterized protein LOC125680946 n=1 Tax=Ostrea edulis TaxID=37623 RepID=UPI0024AF38CD|nr:uncharacterized protein LOC125680946 [Ostrea edulis]
MTVKTYGDYRCFANYFWSDPENGCVACKAGSYGTNCEKNCPPGRYGKFCALECACRTSYYCDKAKGCISRERPFKPTASLPLSSSATSANSYLFSEGWTSDASTSTKSKIGSTRPVVSSTTTLGSSTTSSEIINAETNNDITIFFMGGIIGILIIIIFVIISRKLCVLHTNRKYQKNLEETKHFTEGRRSDEYQEININDIVDQAEVSANWYNIITEETAQSQGSNYQEIVSELNKEVKSTYFHHEFDNSTSSGNNGGYIEPESRRPTHSYIEVIEPMIHASDPANSDQDGGSSDKSDHLEEYQDTMNIEKSDQSCSNEAKGSNLHEFNLNDTYLDVVHNLS